MAGGAVAELVEDSVPVGLLHFGMNVVATVAKLCDLLGQKFNTVHTIAKDNALIDLQLAEEGVKAMYLIKSEKSWREDC